MEGRRKAALQARQARSSARKSRNDVAVGKRRTLGKGEVAQVSDVGTGESTAMKMNTDRDAAKPTAASIREEGEVDEESADDEVEDEWSFDDDDGSSSEDESEFDENIESLPTTPEEQAEAAAREEGIRVLREQLA